MGELGQDPLSQGKRRMDWRRCSGFKIFFKEERVELLWNLPNINVNRIMFYIRTIRIRNFGTQVLPIHVISVSKIHVFINQERWSLIPWQFPFVALLFLRTSEVSDWSNWACFGQWDWWRKDYWNLRPAGMIRLRKWKRRKWTSGNLWNILCRYAAAPYFAPSGHGKGDKTTR